VSTLATARVHLTYWWRHRRPLALAEPRLFTEWVQHRKLYDRDHRLPLLADKVAAKQWVAERLGDDWVIPTLWHGGALPPLPLWPTPFVVKARHGCRQSAFVHDPAVDWAALRRLGERWTARHYGYWLDEWLYRHIPRGLLIEPYIGAGPTLPIDYKCYVFGGRVEFVQVHLDRAGAHRWIVMDRDWCRVSAPSPDPDPKPPKTLSAIIAAEETLARGHEFVRADFYEVDGRPLFGEFTFYPGSGLDPFDPIALDRDMGEHWRRVRAAPTA
jgi:TupA-like ATPgrasp